MEAPYTKFLYDADVQFRDQDPHVYKFLERIGRNTDAKGSAWQSASAVAARRRPPKGFSLVAACVITDPDRSSNLPS